MLIVLFNATATLCLVDAIVYSAPLNLSDDYIICEDLLSLNRGGVRKLCAVEEYGLTKLNRKPKNNRYEILYFTLRLTSSKKYQLTSLEKIKNYIDQNNPCFPSAKEMEKNGIQLGEMNMLLMRKIEELTLHLTEQNRMIAELNERSVSPDNSGKKIEELTLYMIEQNKKLDGQSDMLLKQQRMIETQTTNQQT